MLLKSETTALKLNRLHKMFTIC